MSFLQDLFKPNVEKLESRSNVQGLIKALGYKEAKVRSDAAEALGRLKDNNTVVPLVLHALKDGDSGVLRQAAAEALGRIGDPCAVEPLIAVLENPDEAEFAKDRYLEERYLKASCRLGPSTHYLGEVAAEALGRIGDPRAVEPLIAALKYDPVRNDNMTYLYLNALSIKTLEEGMKIFHAFLLCGSLRRSAALRRAAAEALGQIGDSRAVEPLSAVLKDGVEDLCSYARKLSLLVRDIVKDRFLALTLGSSALSKSEEKIRDILMSISTLDPIIDGKEWRVIKADICQAAAEALKQINIKPGRDAQAGRKETSSVGKQKAHELAVAWWSSDKSTPLRATGHATCDHCNRDIPIDGGYLCNPKTGDLIGVYSVIGSSTPDLMCEQCFDRESPEPWDPEQTARNLEQAKTAQDRLLHK